MVVRGVVIQGVVIQGVLFRVWLFRVQLFGSKRLFAVTAGFLAGLVRSGRMLTTRVYGNDYKK